jgi:2-oxoglutarate ferredoxin oxidoreductase subunit beta
VGDLAHTVATYKAAIGHKGYALVDTLQPCVTFNKVYTYEYYNERVYKLPDDHDPKDLSSALLKGHEWGDRIPLGIFYQVDRPTLAENLPGLEKGPLNRRDISDVDISSLLRPMDGL